MLQNFNQIKMQQTYFERTINISRGMGLSTISENALRLRRRSASRARSSAFLTLKPLPIHLKSLRNGKKSYIETWGGCLAGFSLKSQWTWGRRASGSKSFGRGVEGVLVLRALELLAEPTLVLASNFSTMVVLVACRTWSMRGLSSGSNL